MRSIHEIRRALLLVPLLAALACRSGMPPGEAPPLAAMSGDTIEVSSVTRPGYALIDHLEGLTKTDALARIRGARWEYVVLQQGPTSRAIDRDTLVLAAQRLEPSMRAAGARPALYMVWPTAADAGRTISIPRRSAPISWRS